MTFIIELHQIKLHKILHIIVIIFFQVNSNTHGLNLPLPNAMGWNNLRNMILWLYIKAFTLDIYFLFEGLFCAVVWHTVTGLPNFGFTPLLWLPQGPQGCLEKQNYPLSSNLVIWCTKIGPQTKKVRKTSEMTRKTSKNDDTFQSFLVLVHQTTKFEISG